MYVMYKTFDPPEKSNPDLLEGREDGYSTCLGVRDTVFFRIRMYFQMAVLCYFRQDNVLL
jgi:hypothetical protein